MRVSPSTRTTTIVLFWPVRAMCFPSLNEPRNTDQETAWLKMMDGEDRKREEEKRRGEDEKRRTCE